MTILERVETQLHAIATPLQAGLSVLKLEEVFGRKLGKLFAKTTSDVVVDVLLRADVLRVTLICLYADGKLSDNETRVILPLVTKLAAQLSKLRPDVYGRFEVIHTNSVDKFYRIYWQDSGPFGFTCQETKWRGLQLCRVIDGDVADGAQSQRFVECLLELANELSAVDGIDDRSRPALERLVADLSKHRNTSCQPAPEQPHKGHPKGVELAPLTREQPDHDCVNELTTDESEPSSQVVQTETTLWTVVAPGKKRTGLTRSSLQQAVSVGRLPETAFLKAEDGSSDWIQAAVCDWLFDSPAIDTTRYCRECLCRVDGTESRFLERPPCPGCGRATEYIDFLDRDFPPLDGIPVEPWGIFDWIIIAITVVYLITATCCAISLLTASSFLPVLLSFILLTGAGGLFAYSYQHRSESSKYRVHLEKIETALSERTDDLRTTRREYRLLQRNLQFVRDALVEKTNEKCLAMELETLEALDNAQHQAGTAQRVAQKYLDEQRKWWTQKLRGDNFQLQKSRIEKAINFVERESFSIPEKMKREIFDQLKQDYEIRVRKETEAERQRVAKAKLRAEQKAAKDVEEALARAEAERKAIQEALDDALARAGKEHSAEVEELQRQLLEAEQRGERAVSQAQLTKVGYVYVISNIGCFGENVFKVGLTRRLEPLDRVKELSGASVAFPFDVHMLIFSEDAPALEHTLHKALHKYRFNRVNFRKEFFRVDIETIHQIVVSNHGEVEFLADAEALQYQNSLEISDEDFEFLETIAEAQGLDFESDEE
ncbi:MAG: GIY-YIG nuclease family protein [Fuerstiella sp.]